MDKYHSKRIILHDCTPSYGFIHYRTFHQGNMHVLNYVNRSVGTVRITHEGIRQMYSLAKKNLLRITISFFQLF